MTGSFDTPAMGGVTVRLGLVTGIGILIAGLGLDIASRTLPEGFGVAPSLALNPLHLAASIQIFCGAVALMLAILWHFAGGGRGTFGRLRPLTILGLALCAVSAVITIAVNWLVVMGHLAHYFALVPPAAMLATAIIYTVIVQTLSGSTALNVGAQLVLRSSYVWLLITASLQFLWVAGRVFEHPRLLWFVERPTLEMAMLGFVLLGSLGLLLTGLPALFHSRNLVRTTVTYHQATNALIFGWGAMQAWVIRFPGSYQGLVLSLMGLGLLICCIRLAESSKLLSGVGGGGFWQWDNLLASMALILNIVASMALAITAIVAAGAGQMPLPALFVVVLVAVGVGAISFSVASVIVALRGAIDFLMAGGAVLLALGTILAITLWSMASLVERPLQSHVVASEWIMAAGLFLMLLSAAFVRIPPLR